MMAVLSGRGVVSSSSMLSGAHRDVSWEPGSSWRLGLLKGSFSSPPSSQCLLSVGTIGFKSVWSKKTWSTCKSPCNNFFLWHYENRVGLFMFFRCFFFQALCFRKCYINRWINKIACILATGIVGQVCSFKTCYCSHQCHFKYTLCPKYLQHRIFTAPMTQCLAAFCKRLYASLRLFFISGIYQIYFPQLQLNYMKRCSARLCRRHSELFLLKGAGWHLLWLIHLRLTDNTGRRL